MIHSSWLLMILAKMSMTDFLPAAGITLSVTGLLMRYRKRRAVVMAPRLTSHEQLEKNRQLRGVRGDLENLMVEIEQLAKRFGTQLDAKTIELEDLLQKADTRIAELQRLSERNGNNTAAVNAGDGTETSAPQSEIQPEPALPDDPLARSVYQLADEGLEPPDIAKQLDEHIGKVELILALRSV